MIDSAARSEPLESPGVLPNSAIGGRESSIGVIMPSQASIPTFNRQSSLTPVVCDERAISKLLEILINRSGLSISEVARRMGVTTNAIRQYLHGRRNKPSLLWFVRLAAVCGAQVTLEHSGGSGGKR